MPTEVLRVLDRAAFAGELERAGKILRRGGLVAFPTETVYGIAVLASDPAAVERLYRLKGRPAGKAMTLMIADCAPVRERCPQIPPRAVELMKRFWPGPLTLVLPSAAPEGRGGMIGFRLPAHPLARGLVRAAGVPLLVPSANPSDRPPARTAEEVLAYFPEGLDLVIDGGPAEGGEASTVVQVQEDDTVVVLREGAISAARILEPCRERLLFVCTGNTDRSPIAAALVRRRLAQRLGCAEEQLDARGYEVVSAGLAADPGRRASRKARQAVRELQPPLSLDAHRSQRVSEALVRGATRIFCMERSHAQQVLAFFPHRVRDVALIDPEGRDVPDPVAEPLEAYRRLIGRLDAAAALIAAAVVR